jgi:hypothetical protein
VPQVLGEQYVPEDPTFRPDTLGRRDEEEEQQEKSGGGCGSALVTLAAGLSPAQRAEAAFQLVAGAGGCTLPPGALLVSIWKPGILERGEYGRWEWVSWRVCMENFSRCPPPL